MDDIGAYRICRECEREIYPAPHCTCPRCKGCDERLYDGEKDCGESFCREIADAG